MGGVLQMWLRQVIYKVNNTTISTTRYVYFNNTQVPRLWLMYTQEKQKHIPR